MGFERGWGAGVLWRCVGVVDVVDLTRWEMVKRRFVATELNHAWIANYLNLESVDT